MSTKWRLGSLTLPIIIALALLQDDIGTHHVVSFVLLDMTVPEIASGIPRKRNVNARDHVGRALDDILPSSFIWIGPYCGAGKTQCSVLEQINVPVKRPAIHHLEANVMKMNRMGIVGKVDEGSAVPQSRDCVAETIRPLDAANTASPARPHWLRNLYTSLPRFYLVLEDMP